MNLKIILKCAKIPSVTSLQVSVQLLFPFSCRFSENLRGGGGGAAAPSPQSIRVNNSKNKRAKLASRIVLLLCLWFIISVSFCVQISLQHSQLVPFNAERLPYSSDCKEVVYRCVDRPLCCEFYAAIV